MTVLSARHHRNHEAPGFNRRVSSYLKECKYGSKMVGRDQSLFKKILNLLNLGTLLKNGDTRYSVNIQKYVRQRQAD